jgi:tRNA1Val (adenine37-N6)-methyltransferase
MPNSYFQFKQFLVNQDQCGMKVTTDACIFGAFVATELTGSKGRILDIGTGTGLLSLMLAQETAATIEAIEIDAKAFEQAKANFKNSPWSDRLSVTHIPFQSFLESAYDERYSHIICNPPFFSQHLKGHDSAKNQALHDEGDLLTSLTNSIGQLLNEEGLFHLLLPAYEMDQFVERLKVIGLYPHRQLEVYQKESKPIFRKVVSFGFEESTHYSSSAFLIHNGKKGYSDQFETLLKPYYLHL